MGLPTGICRGGIMGSPVAGAPSRAPAPPTAARALRQGLLMLALLCTEPMTVSIALCKIVPPPQYYRAHSGFQA